FIPSPPPFILYPHPKHENHRFCAIFPEAKKRPKKIPMGMLGCVNGFLPVCGPPVRSMLERHEKSSIPATPPLESSSRILI
ncbi:MAG: hypothetical protein IJ521_06370, partial [Schwartzia sp.]|nr:hypothetical protein [Schwartzia sp. (in: firmicutes)]